MKTYIIKCNAACIYFHDMYDETISITNEKWMAFSFLDESAANVMLEKLRNKYSSFEWRVYRVGKTEG